MPKKCYYKPNRSSPRYFSACDAGRIAQQVVDDRLIPKEIVLACVAKALGFTTISLPKPDVVEAFVGRPSSRQVLRGVSQLLRAVSRQLASFGARLEMIDDLLGALDELAQQIESLVERIEARTESVANVLRNFRCCSSEDKGNGKSIKQ